MEFCAVGHLKTSLKAFSFENQNNSIYLFAKEDFRQGDSFDGGPPSSMENMVAYLIKLAFENTYIETTHTIGGTAQENDNHWIGRLGLNLRF